MTHLPKIKINRENIVLISILVILVAIPLTVILLGVRQELRKRAAIETQGSILINYGAEVTNSRNVLLGLGATRQQSLLKIPQAQAQTGNGCGLSCPVAATYSDTFDIAYNSTNQPPVCTAIGVCIGLAGIDTCTDIANWSEIELGAGGVITFAATASDPDGDSLLLLYNWSASCGSFWLEEVSKGLRREVGPINTWKAPTNPTTCIISVEVTDGHSGGQTRCPDKVVQLISGLPEAMMISNYQDFRDGVEEPYAGGKAWTLTEGDGLKTVYAKFKWVGAWSTPVSASIILDTSAPDICGDLNCDRKTNHRDINLLKNYILFPEERSTAYTLCKDWAADVNCDGDINVEDFDLLQNYVVNPGGLNCCAVTPTPSPRPTPTPTTPAGAPTPTPTPLPVPPEWEAADLNGDGYLDIFDFVVFLETYGQSGESLRGDLDGDGTVTILDVSIFIGLYQEYVLGR